MKNYNFFALIGRLRWVKRWSLMRNTFDENVAEHSWEVATIAHALAIIANNHFNKNYDVNEIAVLGLYHDSAECLIGDAPTVIKHKNKQISSSYQEIEKEACKELLGGLPESLKEVYKEFVCTETTCPETRAVVKAADLLSAYIKCVLELSSGNQEFSGAAKTIKNSLMELKLPEVDYFIELFIQGYGKNLDELLTLNKRCL